MNLKSLLCKTICAKCYTPPQRHYELVMKSIPRDGSDTYRRHVHDLGRYGSQNPNKLNEIGALLFDQHKRNFRFPNRVIAIFKIYDYLVQSCYGELIKFAFYIGESCKHYRETDHLGIRIKIYETISKTLTLQTRDLFKGFIQEITKMIIYSKHKDHRYNDKMRALGMISLLKCYQKQKQDYSESEVESVARNLLENLYVDSKNRTEAKSPRRQKILDDFSQVIPMQVDVFQLKRLAMDSFRVMARETPQPRTYLFTSSMLNFLEDRKLWKNRDFVREVLRLMVQCKGGPGSLKDILSDVIDKNTKTKVRVVESVYFTLDLMHKSQNWLSLFEESELFVLLYEYLVINETKQKGQKGGGEGEKLREALLETVELLVKKGNRNVANLEYVLRHVERNHILLQVLRIFSQEMEISDDKIFRKVLELSISRRVNPRGRVILLQVLQNIGAGSESHSAKMRKKMMMMKNRKMLNKKKMMGKMDKKHQFLSKDQQEFLMSYIYEGLMLSDNLPENYVELFFVLLSHMKNSYVSQARMIYHLNDMLRQEDELRISDLHKFRINSFVSAYFLTLSRTIGRSEEDLMYYVEQVIKEKINDGQLPDFFVEVVQRGQSKKDRKLLKKIFSLELLLSQREKKKKEENKKKKKSEEEEDEGEEEDDDDDDEAEIFVFEDEHLFREPTITKYLSTQDENVKKELLISFSSGVKKNNVIRNSKRDQKMRIRGIIEKRDNLEWTDLATLGGDGNIDGLSPNSNMGRIIQKMTEKNKSFVMDDGDEDSSSSDDDDDDDDRRLMDDDQKKKRKSTEKKRRISKKKQRTSKRLKKMRAKKKIVDEDDEDEGETDSDDDDGNTNDEGDELELEQLDKLAEISMEYNIELQSNVDQILDILPKDLDDLDCVDDLQVVEEQNRKGELFSTFEVIKLDGFYPI